MGWTWARNWNEPPPQKKVFTAILKGFYPRIRLLTKREKIFTASWKYPRPACRIIRLSAIFCQNVQTLSSSWERRIFFREDAKILMRGGSHYNLCAGWNCLCCKIMYCNFHQLSLIVALFSLFFFNFFLMDIKIYEQLIVSVNAHIPL